MRELLQSKGARKSFCYFRFELRFFYLILCFFINRFNKWVFCVAWNFLFILLFLGHTFIHSYTPHYIKDFFNFFLLSSFYKLFHIVCATNNLLTRVESVKLFVKLNKEQQKITNSICFTTKPTKFVFSSWCTWSY